MYKTIIPKLVSIETALQAIPGFHLSENLEFYPPTHKKNTFHYAINTCRTIEIPRQYDARSGYFSLYKNVWYYERKTPVGTLAFYYNSNKKTFGFNTMYKFVPFEIGGIFPAGRHIANLIELELFLAGFITIRACSFSKNNNTYVIITPGLNGKTSIMKDIMNGVGCYIAEDLVIFDIAHNSVYPTSPKTNFGRSINRELLKSLDGNSSVMRTESHVHKLFLYQKSFTGMKNTKTFLDYIFMNSLIFLNNPFIRSYIAENSLSKKIVTLIQEIERAPVQTVSISRDIFKLDI